MRHFVGSFPPDAAFWVARGSSYQVMIGQGPDAQASLSRAVRAAQNIPRNEDPMGKFSTVAAVAVAQAVNGDVASALKTADSLERLTGFSFELLDQAYFYHLLAQGQASAGQGEAAIRWVEKRKSPMEQLFGLWGVAKGILNRFPDE